jgi:glucose-6-phosphate isomerase
MRGTIKYDYAFMNSGQVGAAGYKNTELVKLGKELKNINKQLKNNKNDAELSFRKLPYDKKIIKQVTTTARKLRNKFDNLVVVGIGGSDLGSRAIYQALAGNYANLLDKKGKNLKIYFLGDTTDPQPLADLLKVLNLKKTAFYIVSKSGSTIEPLAVFLFLRKKLIRKVGRKKHKNHFVITTNSDKGVLLEIATKEQYLVLPHYQGGGRFSVLSVNGLLPAACAGFDIKQLLAGARALNRLTKANNYKKNTPFVFASLQYLAYSRRKQNVAVFMPYAYSLQDFTKWVRQLWGESISKATNLKNKKVNIGITPVAALGPTDQHSQIQLLMEGPADKIITFIAVAKRKNNFKVPQYNNEQLKYLTGQKFTNILMIERHATAVALMKNKRPNATIYLPELNEYYLGQLFYFFEMATVYLGFLLNINPYDQPGVEQSKKYMYGLLGKPGYAKDKKEILNI